MGLFKRRSEVEAEPQKCPICTERVPDGATECAMCGADLRTLLPRAGERRPQENEAAA